MSLADEVLRIIRLTDKVESLGRKVEKLVDDQQAVKERLVRLETTIDLLMRGARPVNDSPAALEDKR